MVLPTKVRVLQKHRKANITKKFDALLTKIITHLGKGEKTCYSSGLEMLWSILLVPLATSDTYSIPHAALSEFNRGSYRDHLCNQQPRIDSFFSSVRMVSDKACEHSSKNVP